MTTDNHWFETYKDDPEFLFELATTAVGEAIVESMERLGVTRSELAKRLGVSRPRVTQILAGDDNLTLKTLVAVAAALDSRLRIDFSPVAVESASTVISRADSAARAS